METTTPSYAVLSQNLADARNILVSVSGIEPILDCGSLLGAYRDGGPIKGDEDDIDLAVPVTVAQHYFLPLIRGLEHLGFEIYRLRDTVLTVKRDGSKIDFLFYKELPEGVYKTDDKLYGIPIILKIGPQDKYYYITLYHKKKRHALITKKKAYDELGEIEFCGVKLQCPRDIEDHLTQRYGDWRTPILRPAFSFQNYIDRGVMIRL